MNQQRSVRFAPDTAVLADLRRFALATADSFDIAVDRDDLLLLVGELTANAVVHQGGEAELRLAPVPGGGLRIEVIDPDPTVPSVIRHAPWDAEGHRGLLLVETISAAWGTERRGAGKVVWAELAPAEQPVD